MSMSHSKLTRRHLLLATASTLSWPWLARASAQAGALPPEVATEMPTARLNGSARLRVWGFQVYDARLWSAGPLTPADWAQSPLALELHYLRSLEGRAIAERSLKEMRRQGDIAPTTAERWLAEMNKLFPNVNEGDRITGMLQPGLGTSIFFNGQLRGEVRGDDFSRRFFGIWLSPQTSEPAMRDALLGGAR
jgi:hypothetical protein